MVSQQFLDHAAKVDEQERYLKAAVADGRLIKINNADYRLADDPETGLSWYWALMKLRGYE